MSNRRRPSYFEAIMKQKTPYFLERYLSRDTVSGLKYAIIWIIYVIIGSWIFLFLEKTTTEKVTKHNQWVRFRDLLIHGGLLEEVEFLHRSLQKLCPVHLKNITFHSRPSIYDNGTHSENDPEIVSIVRIHGVETNQWIEQVEEKCNETLTLIETITTSKHDWSMIDAIYYTMTLVTTIGYGHIYPTTEIGRVFCIIYALVGVPLTCILMAKNSNILSNRMVQIYETIKDHYSQLNPKTILCIVTWIYLSVGFIVFMFIPSLVFVALEDWSYIEAFYYTFITLTTIGFGEYIGGYNDETPSYSDFYKISIVVWIMVALGYWVLLLNFLQKAIKSNVPKSIKRGFSKSRRIAKQAEFLRQIISKVKLREFLVSPKVRQEQEESFEDNNAIGDGTEPSRDIMELVVEMAGRTRKMSYKPVSRKASLLSQLPLSRRTSMIPTGDVDVDDEEEVEEPCITFAALMDVPVTIKSRTVPALMTLISRVSHEHLVDASDVEKNTQLTGEDLSPISEISSAISSPSETKSLFSSNSETKHLISPDSSPDVSPLHHVITITPKKENGDITKSAYVENNKLNNETNINNQSEGKLIPDEVLNTEEVTIPLRDVLSIMLFVASCEDESREDDTPSTIITCTPKDSMSLLKGLFSRRKSRDYKLANSKYVEQPPQTLEHALADFMKEESGVNCLEEDDVSECQNNVIS